MLSRLVITFLPRSKRLLISWLQSPSAVILEPQKTKSDTVFTVSPSISHEVMGPDSMKVPNMLLEISGEITPERMKVWSQSKNSTQLWMLLVIEARSNAVKSNIA